MARKMQASCTLPAPSSCSGVSTVEGPVHFLFTVIIKGGSMDHDVVRAKRFELIDNEGRPPTVLTTGEGTHLVVLG